MKNKKQERKRNDSGAVKFFKTPKPDDIVKVYEMGYEQRRVLHVNESGETSYILVKVETEVPRYGKVVSVEEGYSNNDRYLKSEKRELLVLEEISEVPFNNIDFFLDNSIVTFNK
jgi:hypothetical protein